MSGMAVAAMRMVPSHATGYSLFLMLYGQEGLVPDKISLFKFIKENYYELAVKNHIEKLVEIHNQAILNDIVYHEKMKLAFNKKKVRRREISNFTLEEKMRLDIRRYAKTKGKEKVKLIGLCLHT